MIFTNSTMYQSPLWRERTRTVAGPPGPADVPGSVLRLFAARRRASGIVVLGARAALLYGALTRMFGKGPPWVAKELLLDPPRRGPWASLKQALYRWALRDCEALVVYSTAERGACATACGGPAERCVFVPFHTRRDPVDSPLPGGSRLLAAGRSLRDYATLAAALRQAGCELDVVAPAREARHFTGVPGARFLGEVPDSRYRELLAEAAGVVVPLAATARSAGQAVVLEAMALGKATLSADVPGLRDYVEAEVTGLTYAPGDAADLARQLARLADPALRERLGRAALARARESFTPDAHARAVLGLVCPAGSPA